MKPRTKPTFPARAMTAAILAASAFLMAVLSLPARATSDISNTTIVDLSINKGYGTFVFIRVASAPANPATCSTNGAWHYTLPLTNIGDREMYSMLLTAFSAGATIDMSGLGSCNEFGAIESLRSVRISR
jgi:hypothetical protein